MRNTQPSEAGIRKPRDLFISYVLARPMQAYMRRRPSKPKQHPPPIHTSSTHLYALELVREALPQAHQLPRAAAQIQ